MPSNDIAIQAGQRVFQSIRRELDAVETWDTTTIPAIIVAGLDGLAEALYESDPVTDPAQVQQRLECASGYLRASLELLTQDGVDDVR